MDSGVGFEGGRKKGFWNTSRADHGRGARGEAQSLDFYEIPLLLLLPPLPSPKSPLPTIGPCKFDPSQDGKLTSTFRTSYMPHNVKSTREMERQEYVKNKGKAGKGGEWWAHGEAKFETSSCYRDSFRDVDFKLLRQRDRTANGRSGNGGGGGGGAAAGNAADENAQFREQWFQYRMRKPPRDDPGKFHDILTGQELPRMPSGAHQPGRRAGRVSIDKINAEKYGLERGNEKRTYNIISNAPLNPRPPASIG
ncbi:hypothetical protein DFJ73DRAFT_56108 [Zopfochytrium polystomum]|nr:hypothetical protein DFJ73DRAFT_56108 [Zopfochytrium polystomum]